MREHERERAEEGRQAAEVVREEHEDRRRIAEGGPDQHVEGSTASEAGRVESEAGRIDAENKREAAEAHRENQRGFYLRIAAAVGIPLAFVALIPAVVGLIMLDNETDARIDQNRHAIERLVEIESAAAADERVEEKERLIVRARIRRTDVLHCREIEALKAAQRRASLENFAQLERNGELLGIEITPELRAAAREGMEKTLRRFQAREGGCGTLPSLRPPPTQKPPG